MVFAVGALGIGMGWYVSMNEKQEIVIPTEIQKIEAQQVEPIEYVVDTEWMLQRRNERTARRELISSSTITTQKKGEKNATLLSAEDITARWEKEEKKRKRLNEGITRERERVEARYHRIVFNGCYSQCPYDVRYEMSWEEAYGSTLGQFYSKYPIRLGMTEEDVLARRGEPDDKNYSIGSWGIHVQWVYSGSYYYFENGILTAKQF